MKDVETLFKTLSKVKNERKKNEEKKPHLSYAPAEEGMLSAMYFFRWCNKADIKTIDDVVDKIIKGKVPEQQIEHFGTALIMRDLYETEDAVKLAILDIDKKVSEKTGKSILENFDKPKIERRVMKNVYKNFSDSLETLKTRASKLKGGVMTTWIILAILLIANLAIAITGNYQALLNKALPSVIEGNTFMANFGGFAIAGILFLIPAIVVLILNRHKLLESAGIGKTYDDHMKKMEESLKSFKKVLDDKKIQV